MLMKKLLLALFLSVFSLELLNAQEVTFNDQKELVLKEVIKDSTLTKSQIFTAVQLMLSDWHPNTNSKNTIDYSDLTTGTIITKGQYWLGFHKSNLMYGYNVLADFSCTIRMKDGKYQVLLKVPTITLSWSAGNTDDEKVDVVHVYPSYDGYKTRHYLTKKPLTEFGPKVPDAMRTIFQSIKYSVMQNAEKNDF